MAPVARAAMETILALGMIPQGAVIVPRDALPIDIPAIRDKAEIDGRAGLQHGKAFHGLGPPSLEFDKGTVRPVVLA